MVLRSLSSSTKPSACLSSLSTLRVLVDRSDRRQRFLIVGSASPDIVRGISESLAGRVEFVDISGFDLGETGTESWPKLWLRGGFPLSYLAHSNVDSMAWRNGFIRTFLERDIPQLGITIPAATLHRFWTLLAHRHGQTWNASEIGRAMSLTDKTVRRYLDLLTGTFMVRQLQPWFENIDKRQVKAPKIYLRDTGLLHTLLEIQDDTVLHAHPAVAASWRGFVIEQILNSLKPANAWFWAAHGGGELDLLVFVNGLRIGFEVKLSEAPDISRSTRKVVDLLSLDHLFVVCPSRTGNPVDTRISVLSIRQCARIAAAD